MAGNTEELAIIVRMRDFATSGFKKLEGAVKRTAGNIFSLRGAFAALGAAYGAAKLVDFVQDVERVDISFAQIAKSIGTTTPEALEKFRAATKDTVSDLGLMQAANRAVFLGVGKTDTEIAGLMDTARRLGKVMGRDALEAFQDLSIGIGRQSRLILDNLGIIVKVEDANESYAKAVGKTADSLTDAEKRQAFYNATMAAATEKLARLGPEVRTLQEAYGQFKTMLANVAAQMARDVTPAFTDFFDYLIDNKATVITTFAQIAHAAGTATIWMARILIQAKELVGIPGDFLTVYKETGNSVLSLAASFAMAQGKAEGTQQTLDQLQISLDKSVGGMEKMATAVRNLSKEMEDGLGIEEIDEGFAAILEHERELVKVSAKLGEEWNKYLEASERYSDKQQEVDRQQIATLEALAQKHLEMYDAATGAEKAFAQLADEARQMGRIAYQSIIAASDSLAYNLTDGLLAVIDGTKSAKEAFSDMARSILKDLARIAIQQTIMSAIGSAIGGIAGAFAGGGSGVDVNFARGAGASGISQVIPVSSGFTTGGGFASGGIVYQSGIYPLAERGQAEAVVPLPDNRSIPVRFTDGGSGGGGGGGTVNVYFSQSYVDPKHESQLIARNRDQLLGIVVEAANTSMGFRQGMRGAA